MKIIKLDLNNISKCPDDIALCLGFFDGVHLGHQLIISEAKKSHLPTGVLTFERSPKGNANLDEITPLSLKEEIFISLGVDYFYYLEVNEELIRTSAIDFINKVLKSINPKALYCGKDFTFGYQRLGNPELLKKHFETHDIELLYEDNLKISSSEIKDLLLDGNIDKATQLLSRPYTIKGVVEKGFGNGALLGFKTANVDFSKEYAELKNGVYLVKCFIDKNIYNGIANVGVHPSINQLEKPILEVHILDFETQINNKEIKIEFLKFIRPEVKFSSTKELEEQVSSDIEYAKKYFGGKYE